MSLKRSRSESIDKDVQQQPSKQASRSTIVTSSSMKPNNKRKQIEPSQDQPRSLRQRIEQVFQPNRKRRLRNQEFDEDDEEQASIHLRKRRRFPSLTALLRIITQFACGQTQLKKDLEDNDDESMSCSTTTHFPKPPTPPFTFYPVNSKSIVPVHPRMMIH